MNKAASRGGTANSVGSIHSSTLDDISNNNGSAQKKLDFARMSIDQLAALSEELREQIIKNNADLKLMDETIVAKEEELVRLTVKLEHDKEEKHRIDQLVSERRQEIKVLTEQMRVLEKEKAQIEAKLQELQAQQVKCEGEKDKLREEIEKALQQTEETRRQMEGLEEEHSYLAEQRRHLIEKRQRELAANIQILGDQIKDLDGKMQELQIEITHQDNEISSIEGNLQVQMKAMEAIQEEELRLQCQRLEDQKEKLDLLAVTLNEEKMILATYLEDKGTFPQQKVEEEKARLPKLQQTVAQITAEKNNASLQFQQLLKQRADAKNEVARLERKRSELAIQIHKLDSDLYICTQKEAIFRDLERVNNAKMQEAQRQITDAMAIQIQKFDTQITQLSTEIANVHRPKLEATKEELRRRQKELAQLEHDMYRQQLTISRLEDEKRLAHDVFATAEEVLRIRQVEEKEAGIKHEQSKKRIDAQDKILSHAEAELNRMKLQETQIMNRVKKEKADAEKAARAKEQQQQQQQQQASATIVIKKDSGPVISKLELAKLQKEAQHVAIMKAKIESAAKERDNVKLECEQVRLVELQARTALEHIRAEVARRKTEVEQAKQAIADKAKLVEEAKRAENDMFKQRQNLTKQINQLSTAIQRLTALIHSSESQIRRLVEHRRSKIAKSEALKLIVEECQAQIAEVVKPGLQQVETDRSKAEHQKQVIERELKNEVMDKMAALKANDIKDLEENKLPPLRLRLAQLTRDFNEAERVRDICELVLKMTSVTIDEQVVTYIGNVNRQSDETEEKLKRITIDLENKRDEAKEAYLERKKYKKSISLLTQRLENLMQHASRKKAEYVILQERQMRVKHELESNNRATKQAAATVDDLSAKILANEKQQKEVSTKLLELKVAVPALEQQMSKRDNDLASVTNKLNTLFEQRKQVDKDLTTMMGKLKHAERLLEVVLTAGAAAAAMEMAATNSGSLPSGSFSFSSPPGTAGSSGGRQQHDWRGNSIARTEAAIKQANSVINQCRQRKKTITQTLRSIQEKLILLYKEADRKKAKAIQEGKSTVGSLGRDSRDK